MDRSGQADFLACGGEAHDHLQSSRGCQRRVVGACERGKDRGSAAIGGSYLTSMKFSVRFSRGLLIVLPIKNESRNGTSKAAVPLKTATSKRLSGGLPPAGRNRLSEAD